MDRNKLANITSSEKTQKSTKYDPTSAVGAQYLDCRIKIAGRYIFRATDETEMGRKCGKKLENVLRQRVRPSLLEYDGVALVPKLV